ncbi:hypothetical protein IP79_10275 [Porphyrobacter sp. AAP60]|nr:hypothetical protein IP79_10275 [Porphyrobacter sp. AAP60]
MLSGLSFVWSPSGSWPTASGETKLIHPSRQLRQVTSRLSESGAAELSGIVDEATSVLRKAPLEADPFIIAALARYNEQQYAESQALLEIARRRNARSREARYLAVDAAIALGDIDAAVRDLEALQQLAPQNRELSSEILVLLAGHPETSKSAMGALQSDKTKGMVLAELARSGAEPSVLLDAIRVAKAADALAGDPATIGAIVRPLVQAGNVDAAYQVWSALTANAAARPRLLRDGAFEQDLPPPFGWELPSGRDAYAARQSPGLAGETYGRRNAPLARQLLTLPAGAYRLVVTASRANDLVQANVRCFPAEEIARLGIERTGTNETSFVVSGNCRAQWLEVNARASDPPRSGAFRIETIMIVESGA